MQKEIKIIHFPKRNEPYVILAKPSGIPSAPINPDEKDNALSMAINYFPEIKNVSGKKSVEYGLLHRIDTDTNGLLLIATSQSFYDYMIEEQQQGRFIKTYKAICEADKNNAEFLGGFPELKINPYELSENKTIVIESFFRNYGEGLKAVRPVTEDSGMAALKKIGKQVTVLIPEINNMYSFLPGFSEIKHEIENVEDFDLCIALDSSDTERLFVCKPYFEKIEHTIVIDHHITNQNFGDVNYVNAVASSTCQNLIIVLAAMEIAINKEMAECIYTGILTDTGGFRYNTQSETFEFAAMLLETGIDISKIYRIVFDTTTEKRTRLLSRALDRLEILEDGKIAFTYITTQDVDELQNEDGDYENIVNYGRNISGVEVSIFAREKDGRYKISLRANEYVDVSQIASKYAGGGHLRAAGLEMAMPLEQVKQTLVEEIKKQLK